MPVNPYARGSLAAPVLRRVAPSIAIFVLSLATYILTMPRTITLEDGGLFQMVCHLGGIAHPPGYPLFTMLCRSMVYSPDVVSGNLVSALFGALAATVFFEVARLIRNDIAFAWVASLAWAWSATFWSQAIIIEVYTLAALTFAVCWWLTLKFSATRDERYWFALCFAYGLALTDHWPLVILSTMALVATAWNAVPDVLVRLKSPRFIALSLAALAVGLSPYVMLLVNANPKIAVFGGIHSVRGLVGYVERSEYNDNNPVAGVSDKLHYAIWLLRLTLTEFGWGGAPFVLLGSIVSFRVLSRSLAVALVLLWLGSTYVLLMLLNFEYSPFFRAVFMPYPIIACAAVATWFALGVVTVASWVGRYSGSVARVIGPAAIALILLSNYARMDRSRSTLVDHYMRTVLMSLPEDSVLFVRGDNQTGPVGYLHYVDGVRPDVQVRDWSNLVFANRLASPMESHRAQQQALREFIDASDRPVFVMDDAIEPRIDYGAYYRFDPSGRGGYHFVPDFGPLVDLLVDFYKNGYITNAHEQYFLLNRLAQFAKQYVGYAERHQSETVPPEIASRVVELQQTFPGQLVTLREVLGQGNAQAQKQTLLDLASRAERGIPAYASRHSLGVFYGLYGKVELLDPANNSAAERFLKLSLKVDPTAGNTSVCSLYRIYEEQGAEQQAQVLESRYAQAACDSQ